MASLAPADLGEGLAVSRQELRPCRAFVGEDIAVAVYRKRCDGVMFGVLKGLVVELDQRREGRESATDDRECHRQAEVPARTTEFGVPPTAIQMGSVVFLPGIDRGVVQWRTEFSR